jgi:6-phosphogluconolactonase
MMSCIANCRVKIFPTPFELAEKFAEEMVAMVAESSKKSSAFTVALSGGSTPELLYSVVGDHFQMAINWEKVHFFWGDERCVQPNDRESNFGMAKKALFSKINIPSANIHRIRGEDDPAGEATRYSDEISRYTRKRDSLPVFDLVILGLGEDGHTASIFPSNIMLMESERVCNVATHPLSNQKRITLTGRTINNADKVTFLVTGINKSVIVEKILNKGTSSQNFPASLIVPAYGELIWFLDKEAASLL